ncbi:MAG TPA: ABC transporter substrate-binding protein [Actinomycetes bacterium]|nr:ABC transporter substrate-binding protein [Actinomycetes bacterium]
MRSISRHLRLIAGVTAAAALVALAGCSSDSGEDEGADTGTTPAAAEEITTLRLGYFPNFTHAPALVGQQQNFFKDALAEQDLTVTPTIFNAGPDAITALFSGALDITYIGPNPTVNGYVESQGDAVRVIAGAASGGAALVVNKDIQSPEDLSGKTFATPQLGNTQDVAFRYWLKQQGLASTEEGGDVTIAPQSNSEGLTAFSAGQIDGAWVPEPYVSLYLDQGAHVLQDEAELWPDGKFVTTNVIVRTDFLEEHPEVVDAFLKAHVQALELIQKDPATAKQNVNAALEAITGSPMDPKILDQAWDKVEFTADPLPQTLIESAAHAVDVGLLDQAQVDEAGGGDFPGLYDLDPINAALKKAGLEQVSSS